jgi:hypothetical protein
MANNMQHTRVFIWLVALLVLSTGDGDGVLLGHDDVHTEDSANVLRSWHLTNPLPSFEADPYVTPSDAGVEARSEKVCATKLNLHEMSYELITFNSESEARNAGTNVAITHAGSCGACSTLADLAVYLTQRDLTTPVRRCGFLSFLGQGIALR